MRRGRMHIEDIRNVETVPFTVPLYHSLDNTAYTTDAQKMAADDFNRQRAMDIHHAYNETSVQAMTREEHQRRIEQDFRTLMEIHDHPFQNAPSSDFLQRLTEAGFDYPPTTATPAPRQMSDEEFARDFRAEFSGVPVGVPMPDKTPIEIDEKEDVVKKKPNKKKSIFDIIDID